MEWVFLIIILVLLVSLAITGLFMFWAYKLAVNINENPWLWVILTFFLGLLPIGILYLKTGKNGTGIAIIVIWVLMVIGNIISTFASAA